MSLRERLMISKCFESHIIRISRQIVGSVMLVNRSLRETIYFPLSYIVVACLGKERSTYYLAYLLIHKL